MASLNHVIVIGYVGGDPKVTTIQDGRKVANFSLATKEKEYKNKAGVVVPEKTDWHNINLWGYLAEATEKYVKKGSLVCVQGKLRSRSYTDKNGNKKDTFQIEAEEFQVLDKRYETMLQAQESLENNNQNTKKDGEDELPF